MNSKSQKALGISGAVLALAIGMCFLLEECNNKPVVQEKIEELSADGFDCSDYEFIKEFVGSKNEERSFRKFFDSQGNLDVNKINSLVSAQKNINGFDPLLCALKVAKANRVNIFLENSGSMDGYVRGITEYESALADLFVEARHHYGENNLYVNFVNTDVYPVMIDKNIKNFFSSLEPTKSPYVVGNQSVSELNELFRMILNRTKQDDISIFISDCIYSLDKNRSTLQGLVFQQSLTKSVFLDKSKEFPLSTFVLQMMSNFDGKYYDKDNQVLTLSNEVRPYYIWIVGEDSAVREFLQKKDLTKYKGFKNSYFFTANAGVDLQFEVLGRTAAMGRFAINRKDKSILESIHTPDGNFQFTLAVNYSDYPDAQTVLNKTSYKITPGFEIVNIQAIPENNQPQLLDANEWNSVSKKGYSHIITVRSVERNFPSDFSISFTNALPNWVELSSVDDDTNIRENIDKTFGLKYLLAGINGAYETNGINSPTIKLTLNK